MIRFRLISAFSYPLPRAVPWTGLSLFLDLTKPSSSSSYHFAVISSEKFSLNAQCDGVPPLSFHSMLYSSLMPHYNLPTSFALSYSTLKNAGGWGVTLLHPYIPSTQCEAWHLIRARWMELNEWGTESLPHAGQSECRSKDGKEWTLTEHLLCVRNNSRLVDTQKLMDIFIHFIQHGDII